MIFLCKVYRFTLYNIFGECSPKGIYYKLEKPTNQDKVLLLRYYKEIRNLKHHLTPNTQTLEAFGNYQF